MRKTIKKLVALSMASLLFGGTVCIPVYGKSGVDNVSEEIYVDLSDRVLKEGGYLQGDTVYDSESGMCVYTPHQYLASDENSYEKAAQRLVAGWDKYEETIDISSFGIKTSDLQQLYADALNDNPEYFYVSGGCAYSYNPVTGNVTTVSVIYDFDISECSERRAEYEAAMKKALNNTSKDWTDFEKVMYINTYLTTNCEYDLTYSKYSSYNTMVEKTSVCQGYAEAFNDLAKRLGV